RQDNLRKSYLESHLAAIVNPVCQQGLVLSIVDRAMPVESLARQECRDFLDVVRHLPRNSRKRFPKLSFRQASELARSEGQVEVVSAAHANVNLANFSSFLNWAVNEELLVRNPMKGLRLPDLVSKRDKRNPFSRKQLERIFNSPLYRGCKNGERGYAISGGEQPRNARFWIPLIALHTGMRLNEICQLDVVDLRLIDGIECFIVTGTSEFDKREKSLKTAASERLIPVHAALYRCGFSEFLHERRNTRHAKLFPELGVGPNGKRSVGFSKWFTQFTRNCGAYEQRTCFHSFRHNFRDELRAARIEHDVAMWLGGWATSGNSQIAADNYGAGHRVKALSEAIAKLNFEGLDISHLELRSK
ncbi:site-specific integrase, partial [Qipengyuania huizhouensis]|uniref:site-specific integrase n=1 Tax=Qipengyuania huizhouensis TaxID=2867245 RepID=UPI001C86D0CA